MQFSTFPKEITLGKDLAKFAENPKNLEFLEMSPWYLIALKSTYWGWKTDCTIFFGGKIAFFFLQKVLLVGVSWANLPEYALPECEGVISKSSFSSGKDNFR